MLQARHLGPARVGDLVTVEGAGAYCSGMSTKNYNSFPEAPEVLLDLNKEFHLIRRYTSSLPLRFDRFGIRLVR